MNFLLCFAVLLPIAASSPRPTNHQHPNRPHQVVKPKPHHPPRQTAANADWRPALLPDFHLNPDWSPDPNNIAPIDLDGISPWNDAGRSQMIEFQPGPWVVCPASYLNCRKCPSDFRCNLKSSSSTSSSPRSTSRPTSNPKPLKTSIEQPPPPNHEGEVSAVTGPQLTGVKSSTAKAKPACPLQQCGDNTRLQCGLGAKCKNNYCACPNGRKGALSTARGFTWPNARTVFVNPGVACALPCENVFCSEVKSHQGCPGSLYEAPEPKKVEASWPSIIVGASTGVMSMGAVGGVEQFAVPVPTGGHGAIQIPGDMAPDATLGVVNDGNMRENV